MRTSALRLRRGLNLSAGRYFQPASAPRGAASSTIPTLCMSQAPTHDEIIDRCLAVQPLADRQVTLLTYDMGQSTRARAAGLRVIKLTKPIGEEPK